MYCLCQNFYICLFLAPNLSSEFAFLLYLCLFLYVLEFGLLYRSSGYSLSLIIELSNIWKNINLFNTCCIQESYLALCIINSL